MFKHVVNYDILIRFLSYFRNMFKNFFFFYKVDNFVSLVNKILMITKKTQERKTKEIKHKNK